MHDLRADVLARSEHHQVLVFSEEDQRAAREPKSAGDEEVEAYEVALRNIRGGRESCLD